MTASRIICITGGIGSGKSSVSQVLQEAGYPVYNSDQRAKELMGRDGPLYDSIVSYFGNQAYKGGNLDRAFLAQKIFNDGAAKNYLESIVHPAVSKDFEYWQGQQGSSVLFKESALVFETNDARCDYAVLVTADLEKRIKRVLLRDSSLSEQQVRARVQNQHSTEEVKHRADYILSNEGSLEELRNSVNQFLSSVI